MAGQHRRHLDAAGARRRHTTSEAARCGDMWQIQTAGYSGCPRQTDGGRRGWIGVRWACVDTSCSAL
jgi:hypothetical protein